MSMHWSVTNKGYIFSKEQCAEEDWQIIANELETLYCNDKATKSGADYLIDHEVASTFDEDERELLQLPEIFPYDISIHVQHGSLTKSDFRYLIEYLQPNTVPFINPIVIQSYIQINVDNYYMFNYDQYMMVKLAVDCNNEVKKITNNSDVINYNLSNLARIKEFGAKCDARFEKLLANTKVVRPDKLSITAEKDENGNIVIKPVLLKKATVSVNGEESYKEIPNSDFLKAFDGNKAISGSYVSPHNGIKFVFDKKLQDGLKIIKNNQVLTPEQYKRCVLQPKEIFDTDAFVFDEKFFAERVKGIGEFIHIPLPYIRQSGTDWLPEEGDFEEIISADDISKVDIEITSDNVKELKGKVDEALASDKVSVEFNGKAIPLMPDFVKKVNRIYEESLHNPSSSQLNTDIQPEPNNNGQKVLLIEDNFEDLGYESNPNQKTMDIGSTFLCLKDGIKLFNHQCAGIAWMCDCLKNGYRGVLLADDMGLGKTIQALAFICSYKMSAGNDCDSILIVAPVALLDNWKEEYNNFIKPGIFDNVIELYANNISKYKVQEKLIDFSSIAKNNIILTTYETLRSFQVSFGLIHWSVMVLDEAQKIKTPNVMVTKAAKAMNSDFNICLTGTPVENSWVDLWSIMDFVQPGKLKSLKEFSNEYQKQLEDLKDDVKGLEFLGEQLKHAIDPLFYRRLKKDCIADLPKKNIFKCFETMPVEQKKAYQSIICEAKKIKSADVKKKNILEIIAMLRNISLFPDLNGMNLSAYLHSDTESIINKSARLKKTFEILHDIKTKNEKVLIFIISRKMQQLLRYLIEREFSIKVGPPINGEMNGSRRQEIINKFNTLQGFSVLILSPEAGGVGFNITSANNVIHLSRCWNPAKEDQATDRVYRIGQKQEVNVYLPMAVHPDFGANGSFDEKLDGLLDYKRKLSENVLFPTGDTEFDGIKVFNDLTSEPGEVKEITYWRIEDILNVNGVAFEKIMSGLFKAMQYTALLTPPSNDNGADIVVLCDKTNHTGYLVQCKQTATLNNMGPEGVEQVTSAIKYYEKLYSPYKFKGLVVTNARGFTINARERARVNNIELWSNDKIKELLEKYPVKKFII